MTTLIDDALVYAEGVKAPSGEAVVEVVAALGALAADRKCLGQTVAFDAPPEPLWAAISPVALHRIINNLLDNAQRYGGGDATLRIGLASGAVRIQVDDQGPGVPEDAKSVAVAVTLQPRERTLTDAEIEAVAARIVEKVGKATGGTLRG